MSGNSYKQYQRTQRIIRTEDNYSGGMMYVNTPLDTGYSRVILNLDLAENSLGLKPRAGLSKFATTDTATAFKNYGVDVFCKANSVMRRESDGVVKYTDTIIVGEDVYKVGPYIEDDAERNITRLTNDNLRFDKDRAHCFAWQGQLYHMHKDGLYHFNDAYTHTKIEPTILSPKEAVTNGYNMLATDPYEFDNIPSVAVSGDILGVLPYAINKTADGATSIGDLALNAAPGTSVYLKVILAVIDSPDVKYQCKLQWRESTQGSWEDIPLNNDSLKWDEKSTDGMSGSELLASEDDKKAVVYSKEWLIPYTTDNLPVYVRAMLRVASESKKLYKIGGPSNISVGTVLGAGTNIPDLTSDRVQFITRSRVTTATDTICTIPAGTRLAIGTYIHHALISSAGSGTFTEDVGLPVFRYRTKTNFGTSQWVSQNYYFTDAWGITYKDPSEILNHIYVNEFDNMPVGSSDNLPGGKLYFKLNYKEQFYYSDDYTYSMLLEGPVVIPVECSLALEMGNGIYETQILTYARLGTTYSLRDGPKTIRNILSVSGGGPDKEIQYTLGAGTVLQSGDSLNNTEVYITHPFTEPVSVEKDADPITETASSDIAPVTAIVSFGFKGNSKLGAVVNYDLTTAKGMCFWQNRLVLWGINTPEGADSAYQDDSANMLFFSDIKNPNYFPYTQNVSTFTEPVLHAVPFGDDLLVITATSMHLVALNEDGLSWTTVQIQSNLRFREDEMHLVQVVNNMVLFKSGPQFYLLVPSTTNIGNLVVAPITKNIKSIFDNPTGFIKRLFIQLFSTEEYKSLLTAVLALDATDWVVNTIVDFESIHITYTAQFEHDKETVQPTVDFIYNTTSRVWKVYLYSTTPGHVLIRKDAVKMGVYTSIVERADNQLAFQYRTFDSTKITDDIEGIEDIFSNLHFLDTGMRNQDNAYNKRYREAQLKLSNHTSAPLQFYLEYALDGVVYLPLYAPELNTSVDNSDTTISDLVYNFREPLIVTGTPVLTKTVNDTIDYTTEDDIPLLIGYAHDQTDDMYAFTIEPGVESMLEAPFTLKLRSTILGKGYAPSLKVYSRNTTDFTILDHTWVYRIMNAR